MTRRNTSTLIINIINSNNVFFIANLILQFPKDNPLTFVRPYKRSSRNLLAGSSSAGVSFIWVESNTVVTSPPSGFSSASAELVGGARGPSTMDLFIIRIMLTQPENYLYSNSIVWKSGIQPLLIELKSWLGDGRRSAPRKHARNKNIISAL